MNGYKKLLIDPSINTMAFYNACTSIPPHSFVSTASGLSKLFDLWIFEITFKLCDLDIKAEAVSRCAILQIDYSDCLTFVRFYKPKAKKISACWNLRIDTGQGTKDNRYPLTEKEVKKLGIASFLEKLDIITAYHIQEELEEKGQKPPMPQVEPDSPVLDALFHLKNALKKSFPHLKRFDFSQYILGGQPQGLMMKVFESKGKNSLIDICLSDIHDHGNSNFVRIAAQPLSDIITLINSVFGEKQIAYRLIPIKKDDAYEKES